MAPVGRWQKNRDLSWYAKGDNPDSDAAKSAAQEREEEIKRIQEAEQDALAKALGFEVAPKRNANLEPLGGGEVERAIKEAAGEEEVEGEGGKGVGFGAYGGRTGLALGDMEERVEGVGMESQLPATKAMRKGKRSRSRSRDRRKRDRSRDRENERRHQRHEDRDRDRKRRSRSRSRDRRREDGYERSHRRRRSYSPDRSRDRRCERDRHDDYDRRR